MKVVEILIHKTKPSLNIENFLKQLRHNIML